VILIIDVCSDRLSYLEFVKPIEEAHRKAHTAFLTRHYTHVGQRDLEKAERIIICGTALKDFKYLCDIDRFDWIRETHKPILGICAGMQILAMELGSELTENTRIGRYRVDVVRRNCLTSTDRFYAYFLNSKAVEPNTNFETIAQSGTLKCIIKHKQQRFYGCLFHPEVLNPEIITNFLKEPYGLSD
jgi:GMP synthase-like glutamine amidotransferase